MWAFEQYCVLKVSNGLNYLDSFSLLSQQVISTNFLMWLLLYYIFLNIFPIKQEKPTFTTSLSFEIDNYCTYKHCTLHGGHYTQCIWVKIGFWSIRTMRTVLNALSLFFAINMQKKTSFMAILQEHVFSPQARVSGVCFFALLMKCTEWESTCVQRGFIMKHPQWDLAIVTSYSMSLGQRCPGSQYCSRR